MKTIVANTRCALALVVGGILAMSTATADKPPWAGGGKGGKDDRIERRDEHKGGRRDEGEQLRNRGEGPSAVRRSHFEDRHKVIVRDYYVTEFRGGRCPPGLAKKRNGCLPPGQAKKWQLGRPLPRGVIYYDIPQPLLVQIGPPPSGHRYVRVAGDILLMAIGTGMIVDAIEDLGR